ncbi:E3 ubiquitin-protein ligase TRIM21-like isoform X1 [Trematomus bernacchii]|uniref:E3 ubiquitin-protein ligase TRIM21-like isoform X1 n=1 Tax=Trematomus bernacchii TaxID=40690 RepID=UPI00146F2502|nr:E3 ubiquitin-protein ligase TRIM21-like isoform X1 [Trematomus bernacchii]XP_033985487.1 E3 ubiquitin-protein ligase TRIM21-like isoform X1 [Trematomus bernacchii]
MASCLLSEDQFLCSVCLDLFTVPVTIPCGHNFCKNCITEHWDTSEKCRCPMCMEAFTIRPGLRVNTLLSETVAKFIEEAKQEASSSSSEQQVFKPGEVPCDVCTETKLKALKSCLVCRTSYCETHLEPHLTASSLKRHQLIDPVENLEDRMCPKHDKPLELFCKTDQTCVCILCHVSDHKMHDVVPLKQEYDEKKAAMVKANAESQQMIHTRRKKIKEFKESVDLSEKDADREITEGVQVLTALMESVERQLNQLIDTVRMKQKTTEGQAKTFIKDLEQEISKLKKRSAEIERLSHCDDHLHFLQGFQSLKIQHRPPTKNWTNVSFHPSYEGSVRRAVAELKDSISLVMKKQLEAELTQQEAELKRVQRYAVEVTFDPDTANPEIVLFPDEKHARPVEAKQDLPDNPERFSDCVCVLAKQSFSSGTFYYEVQVEGKTNWILGVVRESINRKGQNRLSPLWGNWSIWRNGNEYEAHDDPPVPLSLKSEPQKVGVFVDYEEGLVSFYDVDAAALIYSFTGCSFTENLYPYFSPGCFHSKNSAPLIILPVIRGGAGGASAPLTLTLDPTVVRLKMKKKKKKKNLSWLTEN